MTYKIEVITTPHIHDNPKEPYFWCIQSCVNGGNWCTCTAGWAVTLEEAWKQAHQFYNKYYKNKEINYD